jgi:cell division protein FtsB
LASPSFLGHGAAHPLLCRGRVEKRAGKTIGPRPEGVGLMARDDRKSATFRRKLILAGIGFFFLVLLISSLFGKKGLIEIYQAKKNYKSLQQEIERLEKQKSRLLREIEELEKNPRAVDREAREKLWLMKPEEKVIIKKNEKNK